MKLFVGVNSDGTEIISKQLIKRYIDYDTGIEIAKNGVAPIGVYMVLPKGSLKKMFNVDLTWEDDYKIIEL